MRRSLPTRIGGGAVAACLLLAACNPAPLQSQAAAQPDPVAVNGVGYMLFATAITPQSRDLFINDVERLQAAGAREIDIGLNSPGGQIDAAQGMVAAMDRLHQQSGLTFKLFNVGLVASAATYVFLNAQERFAAPTSAFLFHAAGMVSTGPVSAERLREGADRIEQYERIMLATMKAHTRLSGSEANTYLHRTVVLNADDARRDGIVDAIAPLAMPANARAWVIRPTPPPGGKPGTPAPAAIPVQPPG